MRVQLYAYTCTHTFCWSICFWSSSFVLLCSSSFFLVTSALSPRWPWGCPFCCHGNGRALPVFTRECEVDTNGFVVGEEEGVEGGRVWGWMWVEGGEGWRNWKAAWD